MKENRTLRGALDLLAVRRRRLATLEGLGSAVAGVLAALFLIGWADFLLELPNGVRALFLAAMPVGAVIVCLAYRVAARRASSPLRIAAAADRCAKTGGEVLAGAELAERAESFADPVTRALAWEAAEAAGRRVSELRAPAVIPSRDLRRPWAAAGAAALLLGFVGIVWSAVFSAEALRVLDPLGDHPPYSPYRFEVEPGDAAVRFGDPFSIRATAVGERLPGKVDWVIEHQDGTSRRHPLVDQGEGRFAGLMGAVETPFRYHLRGPEGRSRSFKVEVILTPRFERVEAKTVWPAYTKHAPVEGTYPEGGLIGVKRSRVTLVALSNRPLASGTLVWKDSSEPPVAFTSESGPEGKPDRVSGSFEIVRDARFELTIVDRDGHACREPFAGRVVLLADRKPAVAILEPPAESYATPTAKVPVVVEAEDDYGLSRAALLRSLNGTRDHAKELAIPADATLPLRLTELLELGAWGLEPGDVLEYYATVADNDPDGAKAAQSKVHRLRIISDEDFLKMQQAEQGIDDLVERYRPINEALEKAKEEAKKLEEALAKLEKAEGEEAEALRKQAREAKDRMEKALAEAQKLAKELSEEPPVFDLDKEFNDELAKLAKELEEMKSESREGMKDLDGGLAQGSPSKPGPQGAGRKALSDLRKKLEKESKEFGEQVQIPLDVLEKIYRLMEYESRFTALALAQEDLARRTKRFGDREKIEEPEEREELRALSDEQRNLEQELRDVVQGIRDAAAKLPKGEPFDGLREQAEQFATDLTEVKAPEALEKSGRSMSGRLGQRSAADAKAAADLLMSFVKRCESMGEGAQGACMKFQPKLSSGMGKTLDQLLKGKGLPRPGSSGQAQGNGQQGQGGSSTAQRGGGKVGVYGTRPRSARSGGGKGGKGEGGLATSSRGGSEGGPGAGVEGRTDLLYGGVPMEAVPGEYRAAVREFFRRVAEESGREGR